MGSTFSTIQIKIPKQVKSEQFKKRLYGYFKKQGLIPATEEEAEYSYWLIVHKNGTWATLGSNEYQLETVKEEILQMAAELKTPCVLSSVWDSDFFELNLFEPNDTEANLLAGGMVEMEEMLTMYKQEGWEALLSKGKTWDEVQEICNGDYTYAEDALSELAPLFGMEADSVTDRYDCCEEVSADESEIESLYFKRANTTAKKARSLDKVFKEVYGEALAPLGFVKIKGKQPYFVRLIGDEIIHVITYKNAWSPKRGYKYFDVLGGIATVYRRHIRLDESPADNTVWLEPARLFYVDANQSSIDEDFYKSIRDFSYQIDNDNSLLCEVKRSLDVVKKVMLPILDTTTDLDSFVEHGYNFRGVSLNLYDSLNFESYRTYDNHDEGLLLIKTNNRDEGLKVMERRLAEEAQLLKEGEYSQEEFEKECKSIKSFYLEQNAILNQFLDNPEWYQKAHAELEKRKSENTEILRAYGLDI